MRRLLATAFAAAVVAAAAACGNDDDNADQAEPPPDDNTDQVCAEAELVQFEQEQQLQQDLAELQQQVDPDEEDFEQEAVDLAQAAFVNWSEGLRAPAAEAEDPELAGTLTDLADTLAEVAPQLSIEALTGGEMPEAERLDSIGEDLNEICGPPEGVPPEGGVPPEDLPPQESP